MATDMAPANSAEPAESVLADPSDGLDNSPESWDYAEPDEDQAKPEPAPAETDSNSETDEAQPSQEADAPDTAEPETTDKAQTAEPDDSIVVALPGGDKVELKELKSGYMRDRDYRHKTTDLANKRRELESMSARVAQTADAISETLMSQVPKAPDQSLSITDPVRYIQEKAQHEATMEFVKSIVEKATSAKDVVNTLTREQQTEIVQSEIAKLTEAFPQTKTPEGQKKFFETALSAAKELGFTDQELGAVTDHRYFKVAYYAKLGMEAEAAKAKAASKVVNVPPVATQKRQAGPTAVKTRANQDAMRRLASTGSIHDAMAVDFD